MRSISQTAKLHANSIYKINFNPIWYGIFEIHETKKIPPPPPPLKSRKLLHQPLSYHASAYSLEI